MVVLAPAALAVVSGFSLGLGLIVAIGSQNAFVLRQGLRLEHVGAVVALCTLSDLALIGAGVVGVGTAVTRLPWLVPVMSFAGALFLLCYGVRAARRAVRPSVLLADAAGTGRGLATTVGTCLALTWLNPHVYLDTVVLLGSTASSYDGQRWLFGIGAALGSAVWFTCLGFGARLLRPLFARPTAWRVLDGGIALVMAVLAVGLMARGVDA
jgi:L-lysine exporter family protein LysE/ArgO